MAFYLTPELYEEIKGHLEYVESRGYSTALLHSEFGYDTELVEMTMARRRIEQDGKEPPAFEKEPIVFTQEEAALVAKKLGADGKATDLRTAILTASVAEVKPK